MSADTHSEKHYVKTWGILLALLVVSVVGPFLGHPVVTLVTAFGIALVKAFLVMKNFMHLNLELKWVRYLLAAMLGFVLVMFAGIAPDVMRHQGHNWENNAAKSVTEKALKEQKASEHH